LPGDDGGSGEDKGARSTGSSMKASFVEPSFGGSLGDRVTAMMGAWGRCGRRVGGGSGKATASSGLAMGAAADLAAAAESGLMALLKRSIPAYGRLCCRLTLLSWESAGADDSEAVDRKLRGGKFMMAK
jgi:hypothetical protein